jgi:hypothetical protein
VDDEECGTIGGMTEREESDVLGGNLSQYHFVHHKSHMTFPELRPGSPRLEASN